MFQLFLSTATKQLYPNTYENKEDKKSTPNFIESNSTYSCEIPRRSASGSIISSTWDIIDSDAGKTHSLTDDQILLLQDKGFSLPTLVEETDAGGINTEMKIGGKKVDITIPTDLPKTDVIAAFLDGTPIVPFSIKEDGEEKVIDTSRKQIKAWHEQLLSMSVENDAIAASRKDTSVFRDLRIITDNAEAGKSSKVAWVKQEMVQSGLELGETNDIGLNVNLEYNSLENKEFKSEVVVESEQKYQFILTSSMEVGDSDFKHNLRMKFTKKQVDQLKKGQTSAERYFDDYGITTKPDPVLDWSHEKRKFVLRKYEDFQRTIFKDEIDCTLEDLKNLFGFEIAPEEIRLDGPVAHLGIKTGKREFSITVPSSLDGFNPTDAIRKRKSILPISIYTNAKSGWGQYI